MICTSYIVKGKSFGLNSFHERSLSILLCEALKDSSAIKMNTSIKDFTAENSAVKKKSREYQIPE